MRTRKTRATLATVATVATVAATLLLALAACSNSYEQGPAGQVVDKDRNYKAWTKTYRYELTTRDKDGIETEFKVSKSDHDACYRGSAYPRCTEVR
jgi:hypothetical protein